jgi:CrcB protein
MFMLQQERLGWAAVTITTQVLGSLLMSIAGYYVVAKFS